MIKEKDLEKEMRKIGVDAGGIKVMLPKGKFRILKLKNVRNAIANILKQEMISCGGDVAVNKGCVNCTVPKSDVLIMGTIKQIQDLVKKMKFNVSESPKIAAQIETLLKNSKT